jgi:aspartate racemase
MKKNKQKIGLIGGMGPFASERFMRMLLEKSAKRFGAKNGNDFPEIILDSVPVRDFISNTKSLPLAKRMLVSRVKMLGKIGCTEIAMVCNTGHILFPVLNEASGGKMVSIIDTVRNKVVSIGATRVGLLATKTTINSGLFKRAFSDTNVFLMDPDLPLQNLCERVIRGVIADIIRPSTIAKLKSQTNQFIRREKLDAVILGCTELPLVFTNNRSEKIIDCLDALSDKLLNNYFSN